MARARRPRAAALACGLLAATVAASLGAQQQVYRYTDPEGRVVYSDRPPVGAAKNVQPKRLGANFIENDAMSLTARNASENFPVTLYTFACGAICDSAESLLNHRGVPFTVVNVEDAKGAERLKALTGEMTAPVLQVGDKLVAKGYNEPRWQAMLDEAGYPKTGTPTKTLPAAPPAAPRHPPEQAPAVSPGGYPKN